MSDGKTGEVSRERRWQDRDGTEWTVSSRSRSAGVEEGWVLRSEAYCLVVMAPAAGEWPTDEALHRYLDRHRGLVDEGPDTARLWTDPRSGIEWEVKQGAGELAFRNGTEVVRSARGGGRKSPREMSDEELQAELDEAVAGG